MLGVGSGPQVGPFLSRPTKGSIRGEGTPPTNPSRHLKKKECSSLKWMLKEDQGRRSNAASAAATAAAPPRAAAETAASPCLGRNISSCCLPAAAAAAAGGSQHRHPHRSSPPRAQIPPYCPSTDLHSSSSPFLLRQPLPCFPLLFAIHESISLHYFPDFDLVSNPVFPNTRRLLSPSRDFPDFPPQSQEPSSSEFSPSPAFHRSPAYVGRPPPLPITALSSPSSPSPNLPIKSRTNPHHYDHNLP